MSKIDSLKNKLEESNKKIEQIKKDMRDSLKEGFMDCCKEVFEKYPYLTSFSWTAYTPYFNDGEPCQFEVHADDLDLVFEDGTEMEGVWDWRPNKEYYTDQKEVVDTFPEAINFNLREISSLVYAIGEENLKWMFGDGVRVTVSRNGVEVDKYDHD